MSYLSRLTTVAVFISLMIPIIVAVFKFFGVPFETYANYIFWAVALGIFYTLMPEGRPSVFADK